MDTRDPLRNVANTNSNEPQANVQEILKQPESIVTTSEDKENGFEIPSTTTTNKTTGDTGIKPKGGLRLSFLKTFDPLYSESPERQVTHSSNLEPSKGNSVSEDRFDASHNLLRPSLPTVDVSDEEGCFVDASEDQIVENQVPINKNIQLEESLLKFYTPEKSLDKKTYDAPLETTFNLPSEDQSALVHPEICVSNNDQSSKDACASSNTLPISESEIVNAISRKLSGDADIAPIRSKFTITESELENYNRLQEERLLTEDEDFSSGTHQEATSNVVKVEGVYSTSLEKNLSPIKSDISLEVDVNAEESTELQTNDITTEVTRSFDNFQEMKLSDTSQEVPNLNGTIIIDKSNPNSIEGKVVEAVVPDSHTTERQPQLQSGPISRNPENKTTTENENIITKVGTDSPSKQPSVDSTELSNNSENKDIKERSKVEKPMELSSFLCNTPDKNAKESKTETEKMIIDSPTKQSSSYKSEVFEKTTNEITEEDKVEEHFPNFHPIETSFQTSESLKNSANSTVSENIEQQIKPAVSNPCSAEQSSVPSIKNFDDNDTKEKKTVTLIITPSSPFLEQSSLQSTEYSVDSAKQNSAQSDEIPRRIIENIEPQIKPIVSDPCNVEQSSLPGIQNSDDRDTKEKGATKNDEIPRRILENIEQQIEPVASDAYSVEQSSLPSIKNSDYKDTKEKEPVLLTITPSSPNHEQSSLQNAEYSMDSAKGNTTQDDEIPRTNGFSYVTTDCYVCLPKVPESDLKPKIEEESTVDKTNFKCAHEERTIDLSLGCKLVTKESETKQKQDQSDGNSEELQKCSVDASQKITSATAISDDSTKHPDNQVVLELKHTPEDSKTVSLEMKSADSELITCNLSNVQSNKSKEVHVPECKTEDMIKDRTDKHLVESKDSFQEEEAKPLDSGINSFDNSHTEDQEIEASNQKERSLANVTVVVPDESTLRKVETSQTEEYVLPHQEIGPKAELNSRRDQTEEHVYSKTEEKVECLVKPTEPDIAAKIATYETKMADLSKKLNEQHQENSELKLQLNVMEQTKTCLEMEIVQKKEEIVNIQAESLKREENYKLEIQQLKEKLELSSKLAEKDPNKVLEEQLETVKASEANTVTELTQKIKELKCVNSNYEKIMEEYERTIATRFEEYNKMKEENETASRHLANIELAFSDVHQKYEKSKSIIMGFKTNEETLKTVVEDLEKTCRQHEKRYEALKSHAKTQIEKSNTEILALRDKYEVDINKLKAIIKRLEIKCSSLDISLQQKIEECAALSALCEEVTGKKL